MLDQAIVFFRHRTLFLGIFSFDLSFHQRFYDLVPDHQWLRGISPELLQMHLPAIETTSHCRLFSIFRRSLVTWMAGMILKKWEFRKKGRHRLSPPLQNDSANQKSNTFDWESIRHERRDELQSVLLLNVYSTLTLPHDIPRWGWGQNSHSAIAPIAVLRDARFWLMLNRIRWRRVQSLHVS